MPKMTSEDVHICTCVCVCSVFHVCLCMHVSMRPPICMCTVYMCAYLYVCTHVYVCVCVCIPVIKFLFPPPERPSFCPDLSLRATAKRRHQEVRNCVYLQTSRSTYVKLIFTYFDLQNHCSFPMMPHLTRQRPLCGILTGRWVEGRAQARLSGRPAGTALQVQPYL